jgi:hypothetical protein
LIAQSLYVITGKKYAKDFFMPFRSKAQQSFLYAREPEVAEKFAEHTPKSAYSKLPEHVSRDKNRLKELSNKYRRKKDGKGKEIKREV